MAKKLNLVINNCLECPYCDWSRLFEFDHECKLLQRILFCEKIDISLDIVKDCPLDDDK